MYEYYNKTRFHGHATCNVTGCLDVIPLVPIDPFQ